MALATGDEFAGHRIEGVAGQGGMGVVYLATHLRLKRRVALKVIAPEFAENADFRQRFERESELAASLDHPNVIPIYHAGEQDGELYITMRFVEGTDLKALIEQRTRLGPDLAAEITAQAAAGLDQAHSRGLVHRDVKPANLLIHRSDGKPHVYLTDFGLTKRQDSQSLFTKTGMVVGTVDYISPEQVNGEAIDARSDVYSLGGVLFHALTGEVPYPRPADTAKLVAHVTDPPPSARDRVPELPESVDEVIARAMAKEVDDRYASARDLGRAALAAARDARVTIGKASLMEDAVGPGPVPSPGGLRSEPAPAAAARPPLQPEPSAASHRSDAPGRRRWLGLAIATMLAGALLAFATSLPFYGFSASGISTAADTKSAWEVDGVRWTGALLVGLAAVSILLAVVVLLTKGSRPAIRACALTAVVAGIAAIGVTVIGLATVDETQITLSSTGTRTPLAPTRDFIDGPLVALIASLALLIAGGVSLWRSHSP